MIQEDLEQRTRTEREACIAAVEKARLTLLPEWPTHLQPLVEEVRRQVLDVLRSSTPIEEAAPKRRRVPNAAAVKQLLSGKER